MLVRNIDVFTLTTIYFRLIAILVVFNACCCSALTLVIAVVIWCFDWFTVLQSLRFLVFLLRVLVVCTEYFIHASAHTHVHAHTHTLSFCEVFLRLLFSLAGSTFNATHRCCLMVIISSTHARRTLCIKSLTHTQTRVRARARLVRTQIHKNILSILRPLQLQNGIIMFAYITL